MQRPLIFMIKQASEGVKFWEANKVKRSDGGVWYYGMQTRCEATTAEYANIQQPLMSNGFINTHVLTATIELQKMRSGIFYAVHVEAL